LYPAGLPDDSADATDERKCKPQVDKPFSATVAELAALSRVEWLDARVSMDAPVRQRRSGSERFFFDNNLDGTR
jgi:hypothetical protein